MAGIVEEVVDDGEAMDDEAAKAVDEVLTACVTPLETSADASLVIAATGIAAAVDVDADTARIEEAVEDEIAVLEVVVVLSPVLAQAKLIFVTGVPEDFGSLRSHVMSTYGQQTLSVPTFAMSPLTNTLVETTEDPTLAPVLSTT